MVAHEWVDFLLRPTSSPLKRLKDIALAFLLSLAHPSFSAVAFRSLNGGTGSEAALTKSRKKIIKSRQKGAFLEI